MGSQQSNSCVPLTHESEQYGICEQEVCSGFHGKIVSCAVLCCCVVMPAIRGKDKDKNKNKDKDGIKGKDKGKHKGNT